MIRRSGWKTYTFLYPILGGYTYYNYRGFNGLVLLSLADADYKFAYGGVCIWWH